ncbi:sigma-70 family RNA polymerase sigma factor [Neobacillus drentensis]|uniref:sigma-70 family RNA polymerase sigma factor n=1 Tax=Neobacillus drentensis TaxID=220684 RepID=UPI001F40EC34|nr:sigma-70 family RNA polymerase sigma factor [Neobacillus drentensis]ULT59215.1 sigma-70 family RNA polymerase sigma factor [Neobacillus drentensis]
MSLKLNSSRTLGSMEEENHWAEVYPKLQRYCRFLAQNKWDGEDIAQETYLKALKYHQHQIRTGLLNKIAYHHWIDQLRKRKQERPEAELDISSYELTKQIDEITNAVEMLINKFTPKQAVIFILKEAFQYQLKEIAEILDTTETAVKASLHRGKKRLAKTNEEDEASSVDSFWDEKEKEELTEIFYEALKEQDPTLLIEAIPSIMAISTVTSFYPMSSSINQSPSSTLCMAA